MIKRTILLILLSLPYIGLFAQIYVEEKAIYNEAEEYLDGEEYEEALPLYHLLEKREVINSNISYKIGLCYLNIEDRKSRSIPYLENAVQNVSEDYSGKFEEYNAPVGAWLLLGKAYHIDSDFKNARLCFEKIREVAKDSVLIRLADFYLSRTDVAELFLKEPTVANVEVFEMNSAFSVYNPVTIDGNEMVLMEKRKFYDAIITCTIDSNRLTNTDNITPSIGSDGNLFLCGGSADGNMLIYKGYNAGRGYDLYYSEKLEDGNWGKYKKFQEPVNSFYNESSAYLSGKTLFFTSNREGSFGGEDIFETELDEKGNWSEPQNLGKGVNSIFDEISPFLSKDNQVLYYCSQGHLNMGGFDLYYSRKTENGNWSGATNMGSPFSTASDDMFFSKETGANIFYTTRYNTSFEEQSKINKIHLIGDLPQRKVIIKGNLEFPDSMKAKSVDFEVGRDEHNSYALKTGPNGHYSLLLVPGDFQLTFNYNDNIYAEQSIKIEENQIIDELILLPPVWHYVSSDEEKAIGTDDRKEFAATVYIKDILFDFNSTRLENDYLPMLDSLVYILNKNKRIKLIVVGHTDAIGSEAYNLKLSRERAKSVVNYLQAKGVKMEQITYSGKGELKPVALNYLSNGTDNPIGRKYNRRVGLQLLTTEKDIQVVHIQLVPDNFLAK